MVRRELQPTSVSKLGFKGDDGMLGPRLFYLTCVLALAACEFPSQGGPRGPAPVGVVTTVAPAALTIDGTAIDVTQAALLKLAPYGGQQVAGTVNRIRVPFTNRDAIAECPPIQVIVQRRGRVANARDGFVDLTMVPVEDSALPQTQVEIRLVGRYTATGNTGVLEAPCRSRGVVERELADVIAARGG